MTSGEDRPALPTWRKARTNVPVQVQQSMVPVLVLTVTAKESAPDLYRVVDKQIADNLGASPGSARSCTLAQERQINVHLTGRCWRLITCRSNRSGTSYSENLDLPAGTVKSGAGSTRSL